MANAAHTKLLDRTGHPQDAYDWHRFLGDQQARPLLFHGTSACFEDSIRMNGLSLHKQPLLFKNIEKLLAILHAHGLEGPPGTTLGVLDTYARRTFGEGSLSLTFDWIYALGFAVRYRGGETVEHLSKMLAWLREPPYFGVLSSSEQKFAFSFAQQIDALVGAHTPLMAVVRFEPTWFAPEKVELFLDRQTFTQQLGPGPFTPASTHLGSYGAGRRLQGRELRTAYDIPVDALVSLIRIPWSDRLDSLFERVRWGGR